MKPTTKDALTLFHDGSLALARIEQNGMRIDVARLDRTIVKVDARINSLTERLKQDDVWTVWKRRFGDKASLGSRVQLGTVLHGELGHKVGKTTKTGRAQVDEAALDEVDLPFVRRYRKGEKLKKLLSTYLKGVRREVVDGYLHPVFNLHLVQTYRSSSDSPNFQNIPVRDKLISRLIRSCFIPRDGHVLVEIDYSALEFRVAACFWRDTEMVRYASDPTTDIHRDMAAECYWMPKDQVTKDVRFYAKNQFVFPELYGSYYIPCARNLWDVIETAGLKTKDGVPLKEHLAVVGWGIDGLGRCDPRLAPDPGTFEEHIHNVEADFDERFAEFTERKKQWWKRYEKRGWFPLMTGFRCRGVYTRNELMNYPIQGPAFHCLLWSLVRLVKWMGRKKMRSRIVGQIHDSIVADVHQDELDDYLAEAKRVMTEDIRKAWDWIIVPLSVEAEVAETNWHEKSEVSV